VIGMRLGRNKPCHCVSGKKYKVCLSTQTPRQARSTRAGRSRGCARAGAPRRARVRALDGVEFRRSDDTAASRKALRDAVGGNPHVPRYLLGEKKLPRHLPDYIGFGDEPEAIA
jgi:hypothetical protein